MALATEPGAACSRRRRRRLVAVLAVAHVLLLDERLLKVRGSGTLVAFLVFAVEGTRVPK
jgi:hypothetical protein